MLSSNPIERNRVLHNKLQDFLKKKPTRNSPTKNSSPLFKQQRQNINKIQQSSKDLLQSSQSPHKSYINTKKNMNFEERCIENSQETLRDKIDLKNQNLYDNLRNNSQGSPEHKMESSNNNIYGKFRNNSQESLTHDKFWNNSPNLKKKTLSFNKIKSLIYESPKNLKEFSSPKQLKNNGISFQLPTNSDDIDSINPDIFTTKRRYSQSPIFHEERPEQINENSGKF